MKKILLILSIGFSNLYFADHAISTNCHNAKEDFAALQNFSGTPAGNTPIALGAASFSLVGSNYSASYAAYNSYLTGSAAPVTMMASERLCFQDMNTSIESNISNISGNTVNISNNAASISSLTNAIGDNQGLIGNAQQLIGVNTNNISSNSQTITSIQLDNLMQFKKLSSGVASSVAISNVDYADEGWSMGVGAGNFNSETEYAFGLSFASDNTSFKIATSKDSSALGINYKFGR
tara:strand:+ start:370 stop:1077 length:708 start_codon:yes stop_codon:yes gene_type:complete